MKPSNFPERKRQRQLGALARLKTVSFKGKDNADDRLTLMERTANSLRGVRTKIYRGGTAAAKFSR